MKRTTWLLSISIIFFLMITLGGCGQQVSTVSKQDSSQAENKAVLPIEKTQNGIKVELTKVEQDSESLKIFITYTNNTSGELITAPNYAKIVFGGKQFESNIDLTLDLIKKYNLPSDNGSLEPGVTADDVIMFNTIPDANKINIALYPNGQRFGFDNIPITNK